MAKSSVSSPIDGLVDLACRDGVDIRPTLLRVLTDLYVQKTLHSAEEEAQFVELARRLIDTVDPETRATVAARLSAYGGTPAALLQHFDRPASAPAILAPAVDPQQMQGYELVDLFFAATPDERRLILTNIDATAPASPHAPSASTEVIRRLENAALARNTGEFARMLQRALGIGGALADRITRDHFGEPIVVAAKVLGMKAGVLQRILLFLNPAVGQSVQRVYDLALLYDDITPSAAERMVAIWRQSAGTPRPSHEPLYWHVEPRTARAAATPAQHQIRQPGADVPLRVSSRNRQAV